MTSWFDFGGAGRTTPRASLPGLRVFMAEGDELPIEVLPPPSPRKYWTQHGVAELLVEQLGEPTPTLVGIDHGFSFGSNPTGWPSYTISSAIGRRTATTPTSTSSATGSRATAQPAQAALDGDDCRRNVQPARSRFSFRGAGLGLIPTHTRYNRACGLSRNRKR